MHNCGAQLWYTAVVHSCGAQLWCTTVVHSCGAQLCCTAVVHNCSAQLWCTTVVHSCGAEPQEQTHTYLHPYTTRCLYYSDVRLTDVIINPGQRKVNTIDDFFHVGFTWNLHSEFIHRPIIVSALELCTPQVVDFLLKFHADLSMQYEGGCLGGVGWVGSSAIGDVI